MIVLSIFGRMYDMLLILAGVVLFSIFLGPMMKRGSDWFWSAALAPFRGRAAPVTPAPAAPAAPVRWPRPAVSVTAAPPVKRFAFVGPEQGKVPAFVVPGGTVAHGRLVRCVDGDTIRVQLDHGPEISVRLYGIDAPEASTPGFHYSSLQIGLLLYSNKERAPRLVIQSKGMDKYGRVIALVYSRDQCVNAAMVRRGASWASLFETCYMSLQQTAQNSGIGIWALDPQDREPPWVTRKRRASA